MVLITLLLLVLQVCNVKPINRKSWAGNLLMWSDLTLDLSFKVKRGWPNLKLLISRLLLVLEVCSVKPTYRKSWAGNLLMWSDLQHQTRTAKPKTAYNLLIMILKVCNVKPTHIKSWDLESSDVRYDGSSLKVKRWFTSFGELSFRWIKICIGSPMRRSSLLFYSLLIAYTGILPYFSQTSATVSPFSPNVTLL